MRRTVPAPRALRALAPWLLALAAAACWGCDADGGTAADVPPAGDLPADLATGDAPGDPGPGGAVPEGATDEQVRALAAVNAFRAASGLPGVDMVDSLNRASQAHADFIVSHCSRYGTTGLSPHEEDASWEGFTGRMPWDRMIAAGYPQYNVGMGEVIAFLNDPEKAVAGWIRTLYHRLPLLDPLTRQVGYGHATIGDGPPCSFRQYWNADVMDLGFALDGDDAVVLYPPDGSRGIPTSFDGLEVPTPPRPPAGWPSGTIVTVQFGKDLPFRVTGHRLLGPDGEDLQHFILAAKADEAAAVGADPYLSDDRVLVLYALRPLVHGNSHRVVLDLERDGRPLHLEWTFRTAVVD